MPPESASGVPIVAFRPVTLPSPGRGADLEVKVTAPAAGSRLPVVIFSHGGGFSMDAYGPLVDHWASQGFAVVAPTHLDSVTYGLAPDDPRTPTIWRTRIDDVRHILDGLKDIEAAVPGLGGRLDHDQIAVAGHSWGATTVSALLGARVLPPAGSADEDFSDPRVKTGVLLALAGIAGDELTPLAQMAFPFMSPDFSAMAPPALLVAGDADQSVLSTRGPDWWLDGFKEAPGSKALLSLFGADHALGGVHAYSSIPRTPTELPAAVALVQSLTTAYLQTQLRSDDSAWKEAVESLESASAPAGRLEVR